MLHYLSLGHFDPVEIKKRRAILTMPLDMNLVRRLLSQFGEKTPDGQFTLGGN